MYIEQQFEKLRKWLKREEQELMWGVSKEVQDKRNLRKNEKDLKYALIIVGHTNKMCMIDKNTNIAYKIDNYEATNEIYSKYTFVRWCRSMDM